MTSMEVCGTEAALLTGDTNMVPGAVANTMKVAADIHSNILQFICPKCSKACDPGFGIVLQNCLHNFCIECIQFQIKQSELVDVKCPNENAGCRGILKKEEICELISPFEHKMLLERTATVHPFDLHNVEELNKSPNEYNDETLAIRPDEMNKHSLDPQESIDMDVIEEQSAENEFQRLLRFDDMDLVPNPGEFVCGVCLQLCLPGYGLTLHSCGDNICKPCAVLRIMGTESSEIKCPYYACEGIFSHREIRKLLPTEDFDAFLDRAIKSEITEKRSAEYTMLLNLDDDQFVRNEVEFECPICVALCARGTGVKLRNCHHTLCKECIVHLAFDSTDNELMCPIYNCESFMEERELAGVLTPDQYETYRGKLLRISEQQLPNTYHCAAINCAGFCIVDYDDAMFECPVCQTPNCLICRDVHRQLTCEEYAIVRAGNADNLSAKVIEQEISDRKAMKCPKCQIPVTKISGCAHVMCGMCKTPFNYLY